MVEHVYKIAHKFTKRPKLLEAYGFSPFVDEYGEVVVARRMALPFDCGIVRNTRRIFERLRKDAVSDGDGDDFSEYSFNEDGTVVITPELEREWTECQICFYPTGKGRNQLFINAPDHNQYFNRLVLDECARDIVGELLRDKVIYRARVR